MTQNDPLPPIKSSDFDREVLYIVLFFAAFWLFVGSAIYYALPVIGCLGDFSSNKKDACTRALELRLIPSALRADMRSKVVTSLMAEAAYDEALKQIAAYEADGPLGYQLLMDRGTAHKNSGQSDEAIKAFRAALAIDPSSEDAVSPLLQLLLDNKRHDEARREAQTFVELSPNSTNVMSWQGWIEHQAGNTAAGIDFYKRAIAMKPDEIYLYQDMAYLEHAVGQTETAIATYTTALELSPDNSAIYTRRAELYTEMEQHEAAQSDLEQVLRISGAPRDTDALVDLARSYTTTEDFEKAALLLDEALAQSAEHEQAHVAKIRMYYRQGKHDLARVAIEAMRKAIPNSMEPTYWEASLAEKERRFEEALAGYLKVAEVWTEDANTLTDIGHVLIELNRVPESLVYFDRAITARPKADFAFAGRARAYINLKNWAAAEADASASIALRPRQGIAYARRAEALAGKGDVTAAVKDYEVAALFDLELEWLQREYLTFLLANNKTNEAKIVLTRLQSIQKLEPLVTEFKNTLAQKGIASP